jgi:integrase
MTLPAFPFEVKKGNSIVKIYRNSNAGYDEFKVAYYANGNRKLETFHDFTKAKKRAEAINDSVNNGNADTLTLTGKDRLIFTRAVGALQPSGIALDIAALQFADAVVALKGATLAEAIHFYVKRHQKLSEKSAAESVDEFVAAKSSAKRSDVHVGDLRTRLGKFKEAFKCNLSGITESELRLFLGGLRKKDGKHLSPRSQNNFRSTLVSFFRWAVKKKYLPADWNEFAAIETMDDDDGEIEIFTPEELAALLTHADEKLVPFLAIGAFAGLRSSEICRLDWKQIGVGQGKYIEVKARDARKTKQRRLVPISDNLRAWLEPYRKAKGALWPHQHTYLYELLETTTTDAKVPWKNNALRHSFISYRMAETSDAAKVSLEAGNSPQMIFSNYRELVTPEEAKRWFSIVPGEEGKVTFLNVA